MSTRTVDRKEKKSFTLSGSSISFLERLRRNKKATSTSFVLDELIREAETRERRRLNDKAISAYYDNLSPEERKECEEWGRFAMTQWSEDAS